MKTTTRRADGKHRSGAFGNGLKSKRIPLPKHQESNDLGKPLDHFQRAWTFAKGHQIQFANVPQKGRRFKSQKERSRRRK